VDASLPNIRSTQEKESFFESNPDAIFNYQLDLLTENFILFVYFEEKLTSPSCLNRADLKMVIVEIFNEIDR
jgi:hypothetical protein